MSTTPPQVPPAGGIPDVPRPLCPYCRKRMETINGYPYTLGVFVILSILCSECHTLLHMGIMPPARAAAAGDPPEEKSPLWKPS